MKKSAIILLAFFTATNIGFAQDLKIDIKEEINHAVVIETNMDFDFSFDMPMEMNLDLDIPMNFDFNMPTDFEFNFDRGMLDGFLEEEWYGNWSSEDFEGDPRIEDIHIILGKDEYNSDTEIVIKNINGDVKVTGYDGDEIVVEGTKELRKRRGDVSDEEAAEYSVQTKMYEGKLFIYVDSPESHVEFRKGRMDYHWHQDDDDRRRINAHFDLNIKIPKKLALNASTVNSGDVSVEKMDNDVKASNVNGSVLVKDARGYASANTVNGNIEVWFSKSPTEDIDFKTVNGKIEIYSPKDLSAVVTFESLHGELYTDFEQIKRLPNRLNKEQDGDGYRYKINSNSPIQIGDGAIEMGFKMVNGDVYIRTRKS